MHQSFNRTTTCINISATYLFRLYHNITPTITCSNAQWILWEFKTFWIMWLSVFFLVSRLINKYRMEYQFGLIQLWIYRMFFIEFFCFLFIFFFNDLYTSLLGLDLRNYFQQPSWIYRIDLTISIGICILHGSQSYSLRVLRKSSGFHLCRWLIEAYFN